jgi:DNA-binding sugar fermentation-stimulating protein
MAHSPSLGCSGLCNTSSVVMMQHCRDKKNKCVYRILLSEQCYGMNTIYIATHPRLAEDVVKYALDLDLINELKGHRIEYVKQQISIGKSRFDFAGIEKTGKPFLLEVKSVPLAEFEDISSTERKGKNYDTWDTMKKVAYFPDGYRKRKTDVISPRALKHIEELGHISKNSDINTYLCFVIQRSDVEKYVVSNIDPIYKKSVKKAIDNGVKIITLQCHYSVDGICTLINQGILDMSCFDRI